MAGQNTTNWHLQSERESNTETRPPAAKPPSAPSIRRVSLRRLERVRYTQGLC